MKKRLLTAGLAALITTFFFLLLTACTNQGYEIETYYLNLSRASSLTYGYSVDSSLHGSSQGQYLKQGNKFCQKENDITVFTETVDGALHTYRKEGTVWEKTVAPLETDPAAVIQEAVKDLEGFFSKDIYEYDNALAKYVMKEHTQLKVFGGKSIVEMTLKIEGGVAYFAGIFEEGERNGSFTIVVKDINRTKVELPAVVTK